MSIFGGNTGMTYEQLQQKRKIAEQLAMSNKYAPRNVGEGLTAIGNALAGRAIEKRAAKREGELDAEWKAQVSTMGLDPAREAIYGRLPYGSRDAALLQHMNQQDALRRAGAARGASAAKEAAQMERTQAIIAALSGGQPQGQPGAFGGASVSDALVGRQSIQMPEFSMGSAETPQMPNEPAAPAFVGGSGFMGGFTPDEVAMSQPVVNQQPPMPEPIAPMPVQQQAAPVGSNGPLSFGSAIPEPQEPAPMDARGEIESSLNRAYDLLAVTPNKGDQAAIMAIIKAQEGKLKLLPKRTTDDGVEYGLTPQYVTTADGKLQMVQISKDGGPAKLVTLPEGAALQKGVEKLDLGTHFQWYNTLTGEKIGEPVPKENRQEAFDTAEGAAAGKQAVASRTELAEMERNLPGLFVVADQLDKLAESATYTKGGVFYDEVLKQLGGDESPGAIARATYIAIVDNQVLPLLRQTFGAAFTKQEGDTLRATFGDARLSPQGKKAVLNAFISQKIRDVQSRGGVVPETLPNVITGGGNTPDAFDPSKMSVEELQAYIERGGE